MRFSFGKKLQDIERMVMDVAAQICHGRAIISVHMGAGGAVMVMLEVDSALGPSLEGMRQEVERAVGLVKGVHSTQVVLTAEVKPSPIKPLATPASVPNLLAHVKKVILVASGKGGVGKSTVAAQLAISMSKSGQSVGLLDADIYGPSQPRMMGIEGQKPDGVQGRIEPLTAHGVKVMSIGLMVDASQALVWRGPIVQKALMQMLSDTVWGSAETPLDILVVDMPPGTGDVQLSIAQKINITGAVIVSTPQDIALIDARKGVEMFRKVSVPILGVIENMSTHICSACGHEEHVFGHGGAKAEAERMGVPFLGEIPLSAAVRVASDAGEIAADPAFADLAVRVLDALKDGE